LIQISDPDTSALVNEYRLDIKRNPKNAGILSSTPQQYATFSPADSTNKIPSVNFPCALTASNESLSLDESSTYFFVLRHEYPGQDDRVSFCPPSSSSPFV
jgi:hypothetical protein